MEAFLELTNELRQFSLISVVVRLVLAVAFGGMIGYERERHGRAAGLRTHILVCLGSAIATLIGHYTVAILDFSGDPMRIGAQVLSGIGFLGAGTIISKGRFQVTGLTTAAGLWSTASIGLALGIGFYEAAIVGTFLVVLTMSILTKFDASIIRHSHKLRVYMEINSVDKVNDIINILIENFGGKGIQVTEARSGALGDCGIEATIIVKNEADGKIVLTELTKNENIIYAMPSI